jgi:hypothetical protein
MALTKVQIDGVEFSDSTDLNVDSGTLVVDATNNRVGVGTSSPDVPLEISAATPIVRVSLSGDATKFGNLYHSAGTTAISSRNGTSNGSIIFQRTNGTTTATSLTIDSSGNVGIGTTSPGSYNTSSNNLVVGSASGDEGITIAAGTSSSSAIDFADGTVGDAAYRGRILYQHSVDALTFHTNGGGEKARIDSSGRLLIGTTTNLSSAGGVQIYNASPYLIGCKADNNPTQGAVLMGIEGFSQSGAVFAESSYVRCESGGSTTSGHHPGQIVFGTTATGTSSTERMRITSVGYLKAAGNSTYQNTTGEYHELISDSNTHILFMRQRNSGSFSGGIDMYFDTAFNNTTQVFFRAQDSGAERCTIRSNGGLANYSANNVNLSDRNVKKDIAPAAGTWDCLKEWEIVNFRYKDQLDDSDLNMGVIAQQIAESCPEVITVFQEATEDQPEKLGVKDQQMMWMAIKALQEAQLRIETLEAEVAALKGA